MKKYLKEIIIVIVGIVIFVVGYEAWNDFKRSPFEKIVYLDVEKIMQDSIAGKSIVAQLKKKREASSQDEKWILLPSFFG